MGDQDLRVNQKFVELLNEAVIINPLGDPREIVKVTFDSLMQWARSLNIAVSGMTDEMFKSLCGQVWISQIKQNVNTMLREILAKNVSPTDRNMTTPPVREAVQKTLNDLADWMRANNYPLNYFDFKDEKQFEQLVATAEKAIETYRTNQEKGAAPLGQHGVYVDTLHDEEYQERMKKLGLV
jgi:hypothetical protein